MWKIISEKKENNTEVLKQSYDLYLTKIKEIDFKGVNPHDIMLKGKKFYYNYIKNQYFIETDFTISNIFKEIMIEHIFWNYIIFDRKITFDLKKYHIKKEDLINYYNILIEDMLFSSNKNNIPLGRYNINYIISLGCNTYFKYLKYPIKMIIDKKVSQTKNNLKL